jgi:hypothetical protein
MDVRRSSRVRDRPDRAEAEVALHIGAIDAIALKVRITLGLGAAARVVVDRIGVTLPDLDDRVRDRVATPINDASDQKDRHALAQDALTLDRKQIGIGRARSLCGVARIKGSERLRRGRCPPCRLGRGDAR